MKREVMGVIEKIQFAVGLLDSGAPGARVILELKDAIERANYVMSVCND
jgi:hypothetical protein